VTRLLLNGSPRGKDGNSRRLLGFIGQGLEQAGVAVSAMADLAPNPTRAETVRAFLDADEVVFAFPLYTDSMPGIVKAFLEAVAQAEPARLRGKRVAFVIQSGFPEGIHTEVLGDYLARLAERLGFVHLGTLRKGDIESIRMIAADKVEKIAAQFRAAGLELGRDGGFSSSLVERMARPRTFSAPVRFVLGLLVRSGKLNAYWDTHLEQHGAFERRFDAPYAAR
jgi:NAD(P)H-dependent FMN reductase